MSQAGTAKRSRYQVPTGILADQQIREAMEAGFLRIDPFEDEALQPATYDLSVGDIAVVSTSPQPIHLTKHPLLTIDPFAVALLQTEEKLELSTSIVGRLGPRSNLLRNGIFVSAGPQIDPGFRGRLFVNLLNITDHPFLIRYRTRFLTVEFHGLARPATRAYQGPRQDRLDPTDEDITLILGRGGASLREIQRLLLEIQGPLKEAAGFAKELPSLTEVQLLLLEKTSDALKTIREIPAARPSPLVVPVSSLEPEPYDLLREISVVVQPADDGFTATFFDANIATSGDTQEEAVAGLKSLLVELFEDLDAEPPGRLGPEPERQLRTLRTLVRRKA